LVIAIHLIAVPGLVKRELSANSDLATQKDFDDLVEIYYEYFAPGEEDDTPPLDANQPLSFGLGEVAVGDLGMELEANLDPDTLARHLGFRKHRLPLQFMIHRHPLGHNAWENPDSFSSPDSLMPIALHWHQLAGVHSIICNTFLAKPMVNSGSGMLICDEVGLGKTVLAISMVAFLSQSALIHELKPSALPPIIGMTIH
jgi:hypothetical protein